jgi:hypothetical protein
MHYAITPNLTRGLAKKPKNRACYEIQRTLTGSPASAQVGVWLTSRCGATLDDGAHVAEHFLHRAPERPVEISCNRRRCPGLSNSASIPAASRFRVVPPPALISNLKNSPYSARVSRSLSISD